MRGDRYACRARALLAFGVVLTCLGAAISAHAQPEGNPFPSTYRPAAPTDTLLVNATILDGAGERYEHASLLIRGGLVAALAENIDAPESVRVIDAEGRWITPGIVDPHSHLGSGSMPYTPVELSSWDVNEIGDPVVPHLYVETTIRTQDPGFAAALAGGVTTIQVLPGSVNLFGGYSVVLKNVPARTPQAMKFPGAPPGMKMACGENPKYNYSELGRAPKTRMGIVAGYQEVLDGATEYLDKLGRFRRGEDDEPPHDPKLAAVAAALEGKMRVHFHCYRADDMAIVLDVARHYGLPITAFHHASEAYKIPDLLVERDVCSVVFANWWGFKMEVFDAIRENAAMLEAFGACVTLHSDSAITGQRLNLEAAKAMAAGQHAGLDIPREVAIQWITLNPARILGLDDRIGSLTRGKNADVVLWSGDPFSVYTRADLVFIDGALVYDRSDPADQLVSDFILGQPAREPRQ